jgi:hypothetical protein
MILTLLFSYDSFALVIQKPTWTSAKKLNLKKNITKNYSIVQLFL